MKGPRRPVWSEGMLLSPQHLQSLDRYHEALLAARVAAVTPDDWGVLSVEIDQAALAAGQLRVASFAGVLPDGLAVAFDEREAPPPRAVAEHFPAAARTLDVHLAVARERDGVPAFADEENVSRVRFATASRPVEDATAPGQHLPVALGRANAVVLFGGESLEYFEWVKIAEVARDAAGQPALVEAYVPPALRLGASPWLVSRVRDVLTRAIAKQRDLAEARHQRETGEVSAGDLVRTLQLFALNGSVPVLAQLAEWPDAPPRATHLSLSALAGLLSTFVPDADPSELPRFSHVDQRASFEPLFARLAELLGGLAVAQYLSVPLEQRSGGLYLARIQDERILRSQLFLLVKSEMPEQQIADVVPRLCKISSTVEIQGLVQAASSGLQLGWLPRPPPQLPLRPGAAYFSIATVDRYWQSIVTTRTMAIYLPQPFDPAKTKVELLAVPPAEPAAPAPTGVPGGRVPAVRRF
jgi:type VI secretion system protein ImpJ